MLTVLSELRMSLKFPYSLGKATKEDRILSGGYNKAFHRKSV